MQPYLEESTPTDLERENRAARLGQEGGSQGSEDDVNRVEAAAHAVQQGERWHHTYLYLTNINETERERILTRSLLY